MKFLEKCIFFLFPFLLVKGTKWDGIWKEQEKQGFLFGMRIFFGLAIVVYLLHYYTVDRAEGLAPSDLWFNYRFGMSGVALLCLGFYSSRSFYKIHFYKVPMLIACALFCYFQTRTVIWYPKVPYLYSFAFVLISSIVFRASIFASIVYATSLLALIYPTLIEAGNSPSMMFSASVVTLIFVVYLQSKSISDVHLFIANQRNFDSQQKIIEINLEFTNQINSFLPKEISTRLMHFINEQRMSVLEAIDEVLRPRKNRITCLYSDVRGFTKGVIDLDGFVSKSLLPNLKASTAAVERFRGIPRKIGDLVFAYFDSPEYQINLINVIRSAMEISCVNSEMNEGLRTDLKVKRYILVSGGEAVVGNISGYDSNIEITAIGRPVNLLSRIDELTKVPELRENLTEGDILLSAEVAAEVTAIFPGISLSLVPLGALNLKIRDFEEITELFLLPITKKNHQIVFSEDILELPNEYERAA